MKLPKTYAWLIVAAMAILSLHCPPLWAHESPQIHAEAQTNGPEPADRLPWWYHWIHYGIVGGAVVIGGGIAVAKEIRSRPAKKN